MSASKNRILDELAKLATDAAGATQGVRKEVETALRAQGERIFNKMEVVSREDFEALKEMVSTMRVEQDNLRQRLEILESGAAAKTNKAPDKK